MHLCSGTWLEGRPFWLITKVKQCQVSLILGWVTIMGDFHFQSLMLFLKCKGSFLKLVGQGVGDDLEPPQMAKILKSIYM